MLLATTVFLSCGDEKKDEERVTIGEEGTLETVETTGEEETEAGSDAVQSQNGVVEVLLTGNDAMQFNLEEIKVKAGQTVRLTLKHVGELPENQMGHNFVLLKQGTDVTDFVQKAMTATQNDYIPQGTNNVIAHTEMIGGGEETTIEFEAPAPGTYTFICSFPGHYVQMQGEFIVEEA